MPARNEDQERTTSAPGTASTTQEGDRAVRIVEVPRCGSTWVRTLAERNLGVSLPEWSREDKHFLPAVDDEVPTSYLVLHKHPLAWLRSMERFRNLPPWEKGRFWWHQATGNGEWAVNLRWGDWLYMYLHAYQNYLDGLPEENRHVYRYSEILEAPQHLLEELADLLGVGFEGYEAVHEDARTGSQAGGTFDRRDYYLDEIWREQYNAEHLALLREWLTERNAWGLLERLGYQKSGFRHEDDR